MLDDYPKNGLITMRINKLLNPSGHMDEASGGVSNMAAALEEIEEKQVKGMNLDKGTINKVVELPPESKPMNNYTYKNRAECFDGLLFTVPTIVISVPVVRTVPVVQSMPVPEGKMVKPSGYAWRRLPRVAVTKKNPSATKSDIKPFSERDTKKPRHRSLSADIGKERGRARSEGHSARNTKKYVRIGQKSKSPVRSQFSSQSRINIKTNENNKRPGQ